MLQNNDLVLLLTEMEENGIEGASRHLRAIIGKPGVSVDALKYINSHRQLDVVGFYERIRKNYNEKRSNLYKNIVKEIDDPVEIITTLHALSLQIFLYSKHVAEADKTLFFKHVRAEEITRVLHNYYNDYDISSALVLMRLIKADLVAFETVQGRREEHETK